MKLLDILLETHKEEYSLNLKEGLIKTVPLGQSVNILKKKYPEWKFDYDENNNFFIITIYNLQQYPFDDVKTMLNNLGWFISIMNIEIDKEKITYKYDEKILKNAFDNPNTKSIKLKCEAKFDFKVNKIPDTLYHLAPLSNWEKIKKIGLVPKSRSKVSEHPERVYLTDTPKDAEQLGNKFYQLTGNDKWVLLKIDTHKVPGGYLKLYQDPNYKGKGYYTLNNIIPFAIEKVKDIDNNTA